MVVWGKNLQSQLEDCPPSHPKFTSTALIDCSWTGHSWGNSLPWQLCCWRWKGPPGQAGEGGSQRTQGGGVMKLALCWKCPKGNHTSKHRWNASVKTREHNKVSFNKSLISPEPSQATCLCQCKIKGYWCRGPHSISDMHRHVPRTKPALLLFVNPLCRQRMGVEQVFPYFHSLHIPLG